MLSVYEGTCIFFNSVNDILCMLAVFLIIIIVFLLLELPSAKQVVFLFSASLVSVSSFLPSLSFLQAVILLVLCLIVMIGRPSREAVTSLSSQRELLGICRGCISSE